MTTVVLAHQTATGGWRQQAATWVGAGTGALVLNLLLFALMPHLLQRPTEVPVFEQPVANINVIRLKNAESPVRRESEKPPAPPEEALPQPQFAPRVQPRLALSFDLNPRLPAGPVAVALPAMAPVALDTAATGGLFAAGDLDAPLTVVSRIPCCPIRVAGLERFMVCTKRMPVSTFAGDSSSTRTGFVRDTRS